MTGAPPRNSFVLSAFGWLAVAGIAPAGDTVPPRPLAAAELPAPVPPESESPVVPPSPPGATLRSDTPLVPGQVVTPIDLGSALGLAGARSLDIAMARERVCEALAALELARSYWLPSVFIGPNWIRHDGQAQDINGQVRTISKSSLFMGATTALGNSVTGPIPGGGPAPLGSLSSILRISDAVFEPLAARQIVEARRAGITAATNDTLLEMSEAYLRLQEAAGQLAIAREAAAHAETLSRLTAAYARSGVGLEADHRRSLTELELRRRDTAEAVGRLEVASADVVRLARLDPRIVVAPIEPPETVLRLVAEGCPLDDLIVTGLRSRPELAEAQALVEASLLRLKQARLRPFIPSVAFRHSAGGFGGGSNSFFGDFDGRQDVDVNLFWELQGLGFADRAIARQRAAQQRIASLEMLKVQDRVAMEVVQADKTRIAADRQREGAGAAVPAAIASLQLNLSSIQKGAGLPGATRPIEVLQPIQALATARSAYLDAVLASNRAQFRLFHALGRPIRVQPKGRMTVAPMSPLGP